MARIRTIKPEFFTSEDIVALTPSARLLYIALWCEADREGRFQWRPATFKLRYFPGDKSGIDACARELISRGLVVLYGEGLAYIPKFAQHQHVNPREAISTLPAPPKRDACARVSTRADSDLHSVSTVTDAQVGREGKEGKEHASGRESLSLPDWLPVDAWKAWLEVRTKVKAPNTDRALQIALGELVSLKAEGHEPRAVLERATTRGWKGLYPPPPKNGAQPAGNPFEGAT